MDFGSAFKAISDVGLAVVGLAFLAVFGYRLLREYIDDLKRQRDAAAAATSAGQAVVAHLGEKVDERFDKVEERLDRIEREVRR